MLAAIRTGRALHARTGMNSRGYDGHFGFALEFDFGVRRTSGGCIGLGRGRRRDGCFAHSFALQFLEVTAGAIISATEAGLIAIGEGEGVGLVGQIAESQRDMDAAIGLGELLLHVSLATDHFDIEQGGLDHADAADAPAEVDHVV
ncbi:MAG: hypothetical protein ABIZ80_07010 [Bryobacteraceae bacterium]